MKTDNAIIIFGPQRSGKTSNQDAIKAHFKADIIIDGGAGSIERVRKLEKIHHGKKLVLLTNEMLDGALHIENVMAEIKFKQGLQP
nr:hypothetical protein 16 [Piscirickettsiaceae bacterium]